VKKNNYNTEMEPTAATKGEWINQVIEENEVKNPVTVHPYEDSPFQ